jgi:hypothetical protein
LLSRVVFDISRDIILIGRLFKQREIENSV